MNPAGMIVYNVDTAGDVTPGYYYSDGAKWVRIADASASGSGSTGSSSGWSLLGNGGTTPGTNFLGTTDDKDLVFKRNNVLSGLINNGSRNTSFGAGALNNNSGIRNSAFGAGSLLSNTSGSANVAFGSGTLFANTTGATNTAVGDSSLSRNIVGANNTAVGYASLENSIGNMNTAVGVSSLFYNTGDKNVALGANAGNATTAGSNNIVIGTGQDIEDGTADNQLNIGGAIFGTGLSGSVANPAGNIGIGTTAPASKLEVNGSATNTKAYDAGTSTTIDFSNSNLAYTSASPDNTFTLTNIKDGGTYTLAVQGTTSGTASFTASGFTCLSANNGATTAGKQTVYTFLVLGTRSIFIWRQAFNILTTERDEENNNGDPVTDRDFYYAGTGGRHTLPTHPNISGSYSLYSYC